MSMINIGGTITTSKLTNIKEGDVQPNAVDLRLAKVFSIYTAPFTIDADNNKTHRGSYEMIPDEDGFWSLPQGHYEVVMDNVIDVGPDEAGWVITRSTLRRNGVEINSSLFDSGYHGVVGGVMHVTCGPMRIQKGTRVAQYLSFKAEALSKYSGSYGLKSEHDKKYQ